VRQRRSKGLVRAVFAPDATHVLEPPEPIREAAEHLAVPVPPLVVRGHEELDARVARAYEMFVATGEMRFELGGAARRLRDVVKLEWVARSPDGEAVGGGTDLLVLDADGRVSVDYQFVG
jgi:hypothetical protein